MAIDEHTFLFGSASIPGDYRCERCGRQFWHAAHRPQPLPPREGAVVALSGWLDDEEEWPLAETALDTWADHLMANEPSDREQALAERYLLIRGR